MALCEMMLRLEEALTIGDDVTSVALAKSPDLAQRIEVRNDRFVTALDLAMTWGNAEVCDQLLASGARVDVPVGEPPSTTCVGSTSLTRAVSPQFAEAVENHKEIIEVLGKHQTLRKKRDEEITLLSQAGAEAASLFKDIGVSIRHQFSQGSPADQASLKGIAGYGIGIMEQHAQTEKNSLRRKHAIAVEMFETFETIKLCTRALDMVDKQAEPKQRHKSMASAP